MRMREVLNNSQKRPKEWTLFYLKTHLFRVLFSLVFYTHYSVVMSILLIGVY